MLFVLDDEDLNKIKNGEMVKLDYFGKTIGIVGEHFAEEGLE